MPKYIHIDESKNLDGLHPIEIFEFLDSISHHIDDNGCENV